MILGRTVGAAAICSSRAWVAGLRTGRVVRHEVSGGGAGFGERLFFGGVFAFFLLVGVRLDDRLREGGRCLAMLSSLTRAPEGMRAGGAVKGSAHWRS
jgi:hypothetical protein